MRRHLPLLLFAAFAAFIVVVVVLKNLDRADGFFAFWGRVPYHDKVGHFVLMGLLSGFAVIGIAPRLATPPGKATAQVIAVVALLIIGEEISQHWVSSRTFSLVDLGCSLAGAVLFGSAAGRLVRRPDS